MPKTILGIVGLALVAILGLGFYANKYAPIAENGETKTIYVSTTTTEYLTNSRVVFTPSRNTSNVIDTVLGPAYRNTTFSLTVPGDYQVVPTQNSYAGVSTSASYNFYTNGSLAFTINVFSEEAWNNIRTQETVGVQTGGQTNFGEGSYIGENATWIFSYLPGAASVPNGVRFN